MATDNQQVDDDNNGEQDGSRLRQVIKDLEKKNKDLESKNSGYEQEKKLRTAGLGDLSERQIKALRGALEDGEDSPEAMRKAAEELKFVEPKQESPNEDQQAQERITTASQSGTTNVKVSAEDEYAAAKNPKEVMAIAKKHNSAVSSDYE